jgi:hypothetical protein
MILLRMCQPHTSHHITSHHIASHRITSHVQTVVLMSDALPMFCSHRYDHHQRGFVETLNENYKTKLSSAGLVYKYVIVCLLVLHTPRRVELTAIMHIFISAQRHFGRAIIENLLTQDATPFSAREVDIYYKKIYDVG